MENELIQNSFERLLELVKDVFTAHEIVQLREIVAEALASDEQVHDVFGFSALQMALETAIILSEKVSPDRSMVLTLLLQVLLNGDSADSRLDEIKSQWGEDVHRMLTRMNRVQKLYIHHPSAESENFRKLLLTFAEDIRVIILMIAARVALMRAINHHPLQDEVARVAREARYLYAPLAHRLGLYAMKSELEDLSLKYTDREIYTSIARKLNETKTARDAYIANFTGPVKARLEAEGIKFDIKGRTKSIFSIWNKIRKQRIDIDGIYDLFAIRIIIDAPIEREKQLCWQAFSIITDMFRPNPARMKDWISIPKANGYESLHTTVYGPDQRWVEVQIRTRRMDEVAEKGLAAHWKYKEGGNGQPETGDLDAWMTNVRDILETAESGPMELMKNLKMDVYDKEVFVFTPRGDLYNLPAGATVLDFAFNIHTGLGCQCTGALVNGKPRKINYKLSNGDTVEIKTASNQFPKTAWLNFVVTSKARNKIKSVLKEQESRAAELGKELLQRRFKNRKIEIQEAELMKTIKKLGYKTSTEFYSALGLDLLDINTVLATYDMIIRPQSVDHPVSAGEFVLRNEDSTSGLSGDQNTGTGDVLVIGNNIKGMNYRMAKCCNPIFGDNVFGFISAEGVVKVHRNDCPNAANIRSKYPYRVIRTRWSGKFDGQMAATLRIVGHDDIGIVTNITSIINKEANSSLRNISIDSHDGLFQGFVVVGVPDIRTLNNLIKKIKTIKGVKDVQRSN